MAKMDYEKAVKHLKEKYIFAATQPWIHKPLAWALYQVWREADNEQDIAQGCWIQSSPSFKCSECHSNHDMFSLYCPSCGAKMTTVK